MKDFLWGALKTKKKAHVVKWNMVCKPKNKCGLGLWYLKETNVAFIAKIGWGLITKKEDLWVWVLKAKYNCGSN